MTVSNPFLSHHACSLTKVLHACHENRLGSACKVSSTQRQSCRLCIGSKHVSITSHFHSAVQKECLVFFSSFSHSS